MGAGTIDPPRAQRVLWGRPRTDYLTEIQDHYQQDTLGALARRHWKLNAALPNWERAADAWRVWRAVSGETLAVQWAEVELAQGQGQREMMSALAQPLIDRARSFHRSTPSIGRAAG